MKLESYINQLIKREDFYHHIQSLFYTHNWERIGGEIFLRSDIWKPDVLFQKAKTANKLYELDTKSIFKILQTYNFQESTSKELIFINIFPSTILHNKFPYFIRKITNQYQSKINNVVFEIIETDYVESIVSLKEKVKFLKDLGYLLAVDDVGKGWSSLNMIIEMEPHFIKLDQYFSINLSISGAKQEMIKSLLQFAHYNNSKLVLEGIEHPSDLATAKYLGVDICQGFLLDKPKPLSIPNLKDFRVEN